MNHRNGFFVLLLALAGCDSRTPAPAPATTSSASQEAMVRLGEFTLRGSVMQTSLLDAGVARDYGIERSPRRAMLLVNVRRDGDEAATSNSMRIRATSTDLRDQTHPVEMRELRVGGQLDYVGTVAIDPPDTIRFDIDVARDSGATATMRFTREFFPR